MIFVGDYIDRAPAICETLQIVNSMADNGNAIALMGNHEYNAMAYHYETPQGFLRKHDEKIPGNTSLLLSNFAVNTNIYPKTSPAVFFGHYWLEDACPLILGNNIVCLDYSIAKKGRLVGYRWIPGQQLDITNFVKVTYKENNSTLS